MRTNPVVAIALSAVASLEAQVYIVDASGGAGAHFVSLPQAVATVPSGSTLRVRGGGYSAVTLTAKGLAIVGEGAVNVFGSCSVRSTTAGQRVLLRNLWFPDGLLVTDAAGPVAIETCSLYSAFATPGLALSVVRSPQVRVDDCRLDIPFTTGTRLSVEDATIEISRSRVQCFRSDYPLLVRRSRCTLIDSNLIGADGDSASCRFGGVISPATPGAPGCQLFDSLMLVGNSAINGGIGGDGLSCTNGQAGGPGIRADSISTIFVFGTYPVGGAGGGGVPPGPPGASILANLARVLHSPGLRIPRTWVTGAQVRGQTVHIELRAAPASVAVLAFSYTGLTAPLEPMGVGSFPLHPALVSIPVVVPSSGAASIPLPLPATLPLSEIYTAQALSWQPAGLLASNTFTLLAAQ